MKTSVALLLMLFGLSNAAHAQQRITLGQTIQGTLDSGSLTLDDGSHYDLYRYDSPGNETIRVNLMSTDFDAFLAIGTLDNGEFTLIKSNDDGDEGTDSQIDMSLDAAGTYYFRANTLGSGETGNYTLILTPLEHRVSTIDITSLRQIQVNGQLNGRLTTDSPILDDDSHYEDILISGVAGTNVSITLVSADFDAYLQVGKVENGLFASQESNDDCEEGITNSCLLFTFDENGSYVIRVNTLNSGETGAFSLFVIKG